MSAERSLHLPADWSLVPIGELLAFKNGLNKGKAYFGHGTPIVNYMDVFSRAGLLASDIKGLVSVSTAEKSAFSVRKGDVLFTRTSETPEEVGVSAVLLEDLDDAVFSGFVLRGRPKNQRLDVEFSKYCFASTFVRAQIVSSATYTTRALTNGRVLSKTLVPFPSSTEEQRAIAVALSDADGVIEGLERLIAKKRRIKQGAMQELLTGKRRLPGFSGEWEETTFGEIAHIRNEKVKTFKNPVAQRCIELEQIAPETGAILFEVDASKRSSVKYRFQSGDVLFGRLRPYLRKYHFANDAGVCSTEIWPLRARNCDPGFLYQIVQTNAFIQAASEAYGTHMPRADWNKLKVFAVQLPEDPEEQRAIATVLEDMEAEIRTLETRLAKARAIKAGMMEALLTGRVRLAEPMPLKKATEAAE
ncbi:restriction endonuclease subunit S [Ruegeria arenilitoris]|uniref:restriction endonuclease subunit S n=1 Tax=Ruegeria arenilitoris TaxID=1173585 RepID=UPI0014807001|nr:restriction endonuclease subunit S [Ruegeria arenilitoris]